MQILRLRATVLANTLILFCVAQAQLVPGGQLYGPVPVSKVVDGDTLVVTSNVGPRTVRLIGIDAPEPGSSGPTAELFGAMASDHLRRLLTRGTAVWLELDLASDDIYGRLLAYVYAHDPLGDWTIAGRPVRQVNLAMVEAGLADVMTIAPNDLYADLYRTANRRARNAGRGMYRQNGAASAPTDAVNAESSDSGAALPAAGPTGPIQLHCALYNPDTPNDEDGEWVSVLISEPLDTRGYYLHDEGSGRNFRLPAGVQPPGELKVYNPGQGVWNNGGDVIFLMRGAETVDAWDYSESLAGQGRVICLGD